MYSSCADILFPKASQRNSSKRDSLPALSLRPIYLAAPRATYATVRYRTAVRLITQRHPTNTLIVPHRQWRTNAHWVATYREILQPVVAAYILADADGFVGRGVFDEIDFLLHKKHPAIGNNVYAFTPTFALSRYWLLQLWQGGIDWCRYARVHIPRTNHPLRQRWPLVTPRANDVVKKGGSHG